VIRGAGRVGHVQGDRVVRGQRRGDPTLGKLGTRVLAASAPSPTPAAARRSAPRKAGGTGADHDDVSVTGLHANRAPYTSSCA